MLELAGILPSANHLPASTKESKLLLKLGKIILLKIFGKGMKILTEFSGKNNHSFTGIFSPKNSVKRMEIPIPQIYSKRILTKISG